MSELNLHILVTISATESYPIENKGLLDTGGQKIAQIDQQSAEVGLKEEHIVACEKVTERIVSEFCHKLDDKFNHHREWVWV